MAIDGLYHSRDPHIRRRRYRWNPARFLATAGGLFAVGVAIFQTIMWLKGW